MNLASHILSGLGGGFAFLAFYLGLGDPPSLSIGAGLAAYVGIGFIYSAFAPARGPVAGSAAGDILSIAADHLDAIAHLVAEAPPALAKRLRRLEDVALPVVFEVEQHPDEAMARRRLLTFYLGLGRRLGEQGLRLHALSGGGHPSLAKVLAMLDEVTGVFSRSADSAAASELARLETELAVIERSLEAERGRKAP